MARNRPGTVTRRQNANLKKATSEDISRKARNHPGTVARRQIANLKKKATTEDFSRKAPFKRLVKGKLDQDTKLGERASNIIRLALHDAIVNLARSAGDIASVGGTMTINPKHLHLANTLTRALGARAASVEGPAITRPQTRSEKDAEKRSARKGKARA